MQHLPQLLLLLTIVTFASKGAGHLSTRFGQPAVFGEILAGLILGPTLLDLMGWGIFAPHGAPGLHPDLGGVLHDLAEIGVILLMFVAGMETDLQEMRRVGKAAFWAATGGVVLPLFAGALTAHLFGYGWGQGFFIGAVLTATSVSISAQTLMELGSLRSKEGSTILGAAVIDDVMGILVLSLVVAFVSGSAVPAGVAVAPEAGAVAAPAVAAPEAAAEPGTGAVLWIIARMLLFFGIAWVVGRKALEPLAARVARLRISEPIMAFVVGVAFLYAFAAEHLGGVAAITGSYVAGVLFAQTSLRERIERGIHPLTYSFFVPIFFINIGLRANVRELGGSIALTLFLLFVAIVSKALGCGGLAWLSGFTPRESLRVGVGMISRGEVGLIVAGYGLTHAIISQELFSAMVLMVLVTTMVTPIGLRFVFPRVQEVRVRGVYESVAHVEGENDR
jgi:Kef-type K+ transport system membrane component KefB